MPGVGDVAGDRVHGRELRELAGHFGEGVRAAGVEYERPPVEGQRSRQGEAEPAGGAGDQCNRHGCLRFTASRLLCIGARSMGPRTE